MTIRNSRRLFWLAALMTIGQAAHAQFGQNLLANGDAETGSPGTPSTVVPSIAGWTRGSGNINVLPYGVAGYLSYADPAPPDHHFQYFADNHTDAYSSSIYQNVDVLFASSGIANGNVKYTASAYLGTASMGGAPSAQMQLDFKNDSGELLESVVVGPVQYKYNGLFQQEQIGIVPLGTTSITVTLTLNENCAYNYVSCNYGGADDLSLVLSTETTAPVLGVNLIANGNAEAGPNAPRSALALYTPGWSNSGGVSVTTYGGTGWISATGPGPADRGVNLFFGPGSIYQDIDVSSNASLTDSGQTTYQVSAWLGGTGTFDGYTGSIDSPIFTYLFFDWDGNQLAPTALLGPAKHSGAGLAAASGTGTLPPQTRRVHISISFADSSQVADDIGFVLLAPGQPAATAVNAASYASTQLVASNSIASVFGVDLANQTAATGASPETTLGGSVVNITDSDTLTVPTQLFYVSPGQVNFLIPAGLATGPGEIQVVSGDGTVSVGTVQIGNVSPGIFEAGNSLALGTALFYDSEGNPAGSQNLVQYDATNGSFAPAPIKLAASTYLVLYGTGIRGAALSQVSANIGGVTVAPAYAGVQGEFVGEDQINLLVPGSLAGAGDVAITLTASGVTSNTVHVTVQ